LLALTVGLSAAWVVAQESLPVGAPPTAGAAPPAAGQAPGQRPGPAAPGAPGQPAQAPPTDARHYSYAIGLDLGTSFRADKIPLDLDSVLAGIRDGLDGKDPRYSPELCQIALERMHEQQMAAHARRNQEFLVQNAKAQGVQTTPSGLQYKVVKSGAGPSPTGEDSVKVHYKGQLIDGTVFDQSYGGEPPTMPVKRVIPGWAEALLMMKVGDKWQLFIPPSLAYGAEGRDVIPPNSTLIFDVELLGIEKPTAPVGAAPK
jgi:FKBP-type peptidyl-prolyl cis-trans isomerase